MGRGLVIQARGVSVFTCAVMASANAVIANEAFIKDWQEKSPRLEQYLLANGWQKEWNEAQPINEILNKLHNDTSIGVNYSKHHGKVTCTLSFMWIAPESPNRLKTDEVCEMSYSVWGW